MSRFILITPAHNEEAFIEKTIESVVNQTIRPLRWFVVNDASTDRTEEVVGRHALQRGFIELINVKRAEGRHFANKVHAFNLGLAQAKSLTYEYIGNLDADISLRRDYYEKVLYAFDRDPKLGIAGGMVHTYIGDRFVSQEVALDSVAGAVQLFRRECFEQIGGYLALPTGGIDAAAEITARMRGWKVRTFPELRLFEQRWTGSATERPLAARIKEGRRLYSLGYGLLFFCMRCINRSMARPRIVGSGAALFGYLGEFFKRHPIVLPPEVVDYLRAEQRRKILRILMRSH